MPELRDGSGRCFCTGCHEYFNSVTAFDKHQIWTRPDKQGNQYMRCMRVDEMLAKGWAKNEAGFWVTSLMPRKAVAARGLAG